MQLSPQTIRILCTGARPLISPFQESYKHETSGLSGGLSCAGYDVHVTNLAKPTEGGCPLFKKGISGVYTSGVSGTIGPLVGWRVPPGLGVLGVTEERFIVPDDICMMYFNKSSNARVFANSAATLAEPGWEGHLTLEIINDTDFDKIIYKGQPMGQVIFNQLDRPSDSPYRGKYQNQGSEPVQAILETE